MGSYAALPWSERKKTLGDEAEAIFLEAAPLGKAQRFGWRRPELTMRHMTEYLKHTPDFYAERGYLVEVLGCGRDGQAKLKVSKYDALVTWAKHQPLAIFIANTSDHTWVLAPWPVVKRACLAAKKRGDIGHFPADNRPYYPIDYEALRTHKECVSGP